MIATKAQFVAAAREMLGAPYHHQGRLPGIGLDCIGLLACSAKKVGIWFDDVKDYPKFPDGTLEARILPYMRKRGVGEAWEEGDILSFAISTSNRPHHLAILTQVCPARIIHTHSGIGKVVEHNLDNRWRERVVGVYQPHGVV